MIACGIVAEYNPFHEGHIYHIHEAQKMTDADVIVVVMSGNFVQRGEPAVIDKWSRAEAAIQHGADLIIELPYIFASQSATGFSRGACTMLKNAKVDYIAFGSECGNLENLKEIASTAINPDHLHQVMKTGMSFPKAYSLLTHEMQPNDILAVSYLQQIQGTGIKPVAIQRTTNYLDDQITATPSALALRKALHEGLPLPPTTPMKDDLSHSQLVFMESFYPYLRTFLLMSNPIQLNTYFLFTEGIENHLRLCAKNNDSFEGFMNDAVTSRYTAGRIRRCLLQAMGQVTKSESKKMMQPDYIRVLAFNDRGRSYLKQIKGSIKIASRFAEVPQPWRAVEYRMCMLYASMLKHEAAVRLLQNEIGGAHYLGKKSL